MTVRGWTWWALAGAANLAVGASLLLRGPVKPAASAIRHVSGSDGTVTQPGDRRDETKPATRRAAKADWRAPFASATSHGAAAPASLPLLARSVEPPAQRLPWSPTPVVTAPAPTPERPKPEPARASARRRALLAPLASWSKPGLCSTSDDAQATRDKLTERFRQVDEGEAGKLYLDPRLAEDADKLVLAVLEPAQLAAKQSLGLQPPPPQVFVYFDQQLMKAAACINEDVVAFYDGALHIVLGRRDLQQSVTHEYAHHALFSSGLVGPAWAQEGIAMNLAGETWWRESARLRALLQAPFSGEQMEALIPYKLPADQAVGFYVQAALTVQCVMRRRGWSLQQLTDTLRAGSSNEAISYELGDLWQSSFLDECASQAGAR